jgi:ABC-type amino acid transport system permease subunit
MGGLKGPGAQALLRVLPSLANEFITLIKDTSLAAVICFDELFRPVAGGHQLPGV